jgi:hypothetical protein
MKSGNVLLNHPLINSTLWLTLGNIPFMLNAPLSKPSLHFSGKPSKLSNPYTLPVVNLEM